MSEKAKKPGPSRRKISFAVDRDEIEINSDWVEAVMGPVPPREAPAPVETGPFFSPQPKNATVPEPATGAGFATDEGLIKTAAVAKVASVEFSAPVESSATHMGAQRDELADVVKTATGATNTTVAEFDEAPRRRRPKPRPIRSVVDGLTPGQYTVYTLMYAHGKDTGEGSRLYSGGYADLCRLAALSKRGIQNIIAELQAKFVISLHRAPGHHRSQTSIYRVPPPDLVLATWTRLELRFAIGKSKRLTNSATVAITAIQ